MDKKQLQTEKESFAEDEVLFSVFQGALNRGYPYLVYEKNTDVERRGDFKIYLSKLLRKYQGLVIQSPDKNTDIISDFQVEINRSEFTDILKKQTITFGRVQKLLNLYLKYHWIFNCDEDNFEPPHCPIDSIILGEIGWVGPSWANPRFGKSEYDKAIEKCKTKAHGVKIAEWELVTFNNRTKE